MPLPFVSPRSSTVECAFSARLPDDDDADARPLLPRAVAVACPPAAVRMDVRQYIAFGQQCAICLTAVVSARDAHLTSCGHGFHASCLAAAHAAAVRAGRPRGCPLCRRRVGVDADALRDRYCADDAGSLDAVENFWIKYPHISPTMCAARRAECPHALGVHRDCARCVRYRTTGEI